MEKIWPILIFKKNKLKFFALSLLLYIFFKALPNIQWLLWLNFFYSIFLELLGTLVTGSLFYLVFTTWDENSKKANLLNYIRNSYMQMKWDILEEIILTKEQPFRPLNINSLIDELYLDPKKARNYFTQEIFSKICMDLSDESKRKIIKSMQKFINILELINYQLIEEGNYSTNQIFEYLDQTKDRLEAMMDIVFIDWSECIDSKSSHPLYQLFCSNEEDLIYKDLCRILKMHKI